MHGTALSALQNKCGETSLNSQKLKTTLKYSMKILNRNNHPTTKIFQHQNNMTDTNNLLHYTYSYTKDMQDFSISNKMLESTVKCKIPPWKLKPFKTDIPHTNLQTN